MKHKPSLYVGIDVCLKAFEVSIIDEASHIKQMRTSRYENNPQCIKALVKETVRIAKYEQVQRIVFGFEATANYAFHLPFVIHEDERLANFTVEIYQINPKIIKNFRKAFNALPKTDDKDSFLIAARLKIGHLPPYTRFDPKIFALRTLTRSRFSMTAKLVSEKTRFISNLFIKASGFVQHKAFSNIFGATSMALVTIFDSVEQIANASIDEIISFIISKSKNKIKDAEALAHRLKSIARESYVIDRAMHDPLNYALLASYRHINFLSAEIKRLDKQINRFIGAFQSEYQIITSIKGIGPVFAAGIIAEVGDISSFNNQAQIAKYAGLTWKIKQSGNFKSEETRLTKAGNKYLRYYLVQAAQSLVTHNEDFKPYYRKKYREVTKHRHKRAVGFVARKLIRVLFTLLSKHKLYESPRSLAA